MLWYIVILVVFVVAGPLILIVTNARNHYQQRQQAALNGWHYEPAGLMAGLRQSFKISGQTVQGHEWILSHDTSRQFVIWESKAIQLPYGKLMVMPRFSQDTDEFLQQHQLRSVEFGSVQWRDRYSLLNTHDILSESYFSQDAELTLLNWPDRETPGGLMILIWDTEHLEIKARFHRDWTTFDRIISFGNALLLNQGASA